MAADAPPLSAQRLTREQLEVALDRFRGATYNAEHLRIIVAAAECALAEARKPAGDAVSLDLYSRALDEIWRLRALLAYEATQMPERLRYRTLPNTVRASLEAAQLRAALAARGDSVRACRPLDDLQARLCEVGASPCLTRSQWEAEQPERAAGATEGR